MSHGAHPPGPGSLYGYGAMPASQMSADPHDLLSFLDPSMSSVYSAGLDAAMPMPMDLNDALAQSYAPAAAAHATVAAISGPGDQSFSPDAAVNPMMAPGPMQVSPLGATAPASNPSTLTEFTKRRNWPARVVEELKDLLQILDAHGRIKSIFTPTTWASSPRR